MDITSLFLREGNEVALTHLRSAASSTARTSSELRANVFSVSASLQRLGVRSGDAVLILCGSCVEAVECILAVFKIGATAMPVNPLQGSAGIQLIVERMRPTCCIFEDPPETGVREALASCNSLMIQLKAMSAPLATGYHAYADLLCASGAETSGGSIRSDRPALIIHSSGSSGVPKAVAMSPAVLLAFFESHTLVYSQYSNGPGTPSARSPVVTGLPLSHLAGLATCLQGLLEGRPAYLMSFFLPDMYLRTVERLRCTFIMLVPSLYRALLNEAYLREMDTSALQFCITGGEPCPIELMERIEAAFGARVISAYSMTECLSGIGHIRRNLFGHRIPHGSCGRQLFGEVKLLDAHGNENPRLGELWVRNATVHACYLEAPLNESRLRDGWFRTYDLFERDANGEFFHRGRADDMFICNGKNIYPLEMELLLQKHPAIDIVCAAPVTHRIKGPVPAVLIVAKSPVSHAEIQEFSMKHGPSHTIPQLVLFKSSMPRLSSGKLNRHEVVRLLQEACDAAAP